MPSIILNALSFSYGSHLVLDEVNLHISEGERAFLIGPNGSGKTTLLKLLTGDLCPDSGQIISAPVKHRAPNVDDFDGTVGEYFDVAFAYLRELSLRFDRVASSLASGGQSLEEQYDCLLAEMNARDIWSLEARISETLHGLGMDGIGKMRERDVTSLSPGQRARIRLAALLILRPQALILDEPTNHLDSDAMSYLAQTINNWDGPVLVASHDRAFIEDTATVIYDMDNTVWSQIAKARGKERISGLHRVTGKYSDYLIAKEVAWSTYSQMYAWQQEKKRELREHHHQSAIIAQGGRQVKEPPFRMAKKYFADRAASTSVRRTRNDDVRLERLQEREVRKPRHYELAFPLRRDDVGVGVAVSLRKVKVAGRLAPLDLDVAAGEHLLVTGANGTGKSTLLNWIAEGTPPAGVDASGNMTRDNRISIVPQRLPIEGDPGFNSSVWQNGIGELGKGILHPSMWSTAINQLSDGNQRRAQIAVALGESPALLIIDEPTNYLDLETIEALEVALSVWNGTLIVATHDRWLIDHWRGRHITLSGFDPVVNDVDTQTRTGTHTS